MAWHVLQWLFHTEFRLTYQTLMVVNKKHTPPPPPQKKKKKKLSPLMIVRSACWYTQHFSCFLGREENYTGAQGDFAPENAKKRALENKKEPLKIHCHRLQCKSLFNVADLVNGM